jgi:hypothetical protein
LQIADDLEGFSTKEDLTEGKQEEFLTKAELKEKR